ncbi:response regulator [uncultured Paracoccus sp.]|uniref:hybrid sensor histidine kinase/response regulator n=1 Tax=uncultured Paracoccus sp. TaxID=189685 RepID=UPI0025CD5494|nr:response regulator [uncultured Paracoccus sp.]
MIGQLNSLRSRFGHLLCIVLWCHVPLLAAVAFLTKSMPVMTMVMISVSLAAIYHLTWWRYGPAPVTRHLSAVLLVAQPALLVMLLEGHPWQMDTHMYFFAMIALCIAWFDRTTLFVSAATIAVHHLVLLYFVPLAVFATEGNLARVALHAVIVVCQTVVLVWVCDKVVESFCKIEGMSAQLLAKGQKLHERTREAEQASLAKGMFLANMSHELRTPINAIIGFCHLIQRGTLEPRQRDGVAKINAAGLTLLRLVNDILDLSKNEAGQLVLEETVFDLRSALSRQVQMQSEALHRKNLKFEVQVDPRIPALLIGDVTRLSQILANLMDNAIKFTDDGVITLSVRLARRTDCMVEIETSIHDNGIGMTEEQLSRMFTPFVQADSSITRRFGGTGLGLAICRQIAEQMNGWIKAESAMGQGTTFIVMTPLRIAEDQVLPAAMPSDRIRRLRVLLVDDNPIVRSIVQEIFLKWGMEIEVAESGSATLTQIRRGVQEQRPFDLVIMDWKMPGMDGLQTLRALRGLLGTAPLPSVAIMTSYDVNELRQEAEKEGISHLLSKPVTAESLLDMLTNLTVDGPDQAADLQSGLLLPQALRGTRILLAEDNEINREIAAAVLTDAGFVVDCAPDGAVACEMIQDAAPAYAAVLMDIQMPHMDGITATRRIRETWSEEQLPIIAMTAHAFAEERRKFLDAGMNDHIAKPFDPAGLIATLARWMRVDNAAHGNAIAQPGALPAALPPFDLAAALARVNGKQDLLRRLILSFADSYADFPAELAQLMRDGKQEEAHRRAHTLRGVAASLELATVAAIAGRIEQALCADEDQDLAALLAELAPPLDSAIAAANRLRSPVAEPGRQDAGQAVTVDPALLDDAMATIRDQIRRHSLSARQGFARLSDLLHLDETARSSHPLNLALQRLDYATALTVLDQGFAEMDQRGAA